MRRKEGEMHVNYEYVMAGIILLLIFSITGANIMSVITHRLSRMEQETEYPLAERLLDIILLSPGYPPDWGVRSEDPLAFGLASTNALKDYVLDISKVYRLTESSPHHIPPGIARELMGLSSRYNFNLTIVPVLRIEIVNKTVNANSTYEITVTNYKGFRVPNVNVMAYYVNRSLSPTSPIFLQSNTTSTYGNCTITFGLIPNYVLLIYINHLEVKAAKSYPPGLGLRVEGNCIIESDYPIIDSITYATGVYSSAYIETAFRYVEIDGITYYVRLDIWW
ncbi:MAG: hypothetical protein QXX94_06055 [Candidatus Bathyarchaeia archaeon]